MDVMGEPDLEITERRILARHVVRMDLTVDSLNVDRIFEPQGADGDRHDITGQLRSLGLQGAVDPPHEAVHGQGEVGVSHGLA